MGEIWHGKVEARGRGKENGEEEGERERDK